MEYSEHVGRNLHALGRTGDTVFLYHFKAFKAVSTPLSFSSLAPSGRLVGSLSDSLVVLASQSAVVAASFSELLLRHDALSPPLLIVFWFRCRMRSTLTTGLGSLLHCRQATVEFAVWTCKFRPRHLLNVVLSRLKRGVLIVKAYNEGELCVMNTLIGI